MSQGSTSNVGGLVGWNEGTITNSYTEVSVLGEDGSVSVGGLAGNNRSGAMIENSYATGTVSGGSFVGGLAGNNNGTITNSYARGEVPGSGTCPNPDIEVCIGGLFGFNDTRATIDP